MPLKIQRVPRGFSQLLNLSGGETPAEMLDQVRPVLDLMQLYGGTQLQVQNAANAALAQLGNLDIVVPNNQQWVLFSCAALVLHTATITGLELALAIGPSIAQAGAVTTLDKTAGFANGAATRIAFSSPYPRVLFPGSVVRASVGRIGTDATCDIAMTALVGVLG